MEPVNLPYNVPSVMLMVGMLAFLFGSSGECTFHFRIRCVEKRAHGRLSCWVNSRGRSKVAQGTGADYRPCDRLSVDENVGKLAPPNTLASHTTMAIKHIKPTIILPNFQHVAIDGNVKPIAHHPEDDIGDEQNDRDVSRRFKKLIRGPPWSIPPQVAHTMMKATASISAI